MTAQNLLATVFRQPILDLSAYKVANAANLIKLDAMENPYHWPEDMVNEWLEELRLAELNRYPDPYAHSLVQTLTALNQLSEQTDLLLGIF